MTRVMTGSPSRNVSSSGAFHSSTANFSLEAANKVAAGGEVAAAEVIDHVASLARKSLVTANVFGKKPVYLLLETTRCYALEKLRESGEFDVVARRHAECCPDLLSLAEAAE